MFFLGEEDAAIRFMESLDFDRIELESWKINAKVKTAADAQHGVARHRRQTGGAFLVDDACGGRGSRRGCSGNRSLGLYTPLTTIRSGALRAWTLPSS